MLASPLPFGIPTSATKTLATAWTDINKVAIAFRHLGMLGLPAFEPPQLSSWDKTGLLERLSPLPFGVPTAAP
jgi:hypothetical protein